MAYRQNAIDHFKYKATKTEYWVNKNQFFLSRQFCSFQLIIFAFKVWNVRLLKENLIISHDIQLVVLCSKCFAMENYTKNALEQ